MAFIFESLSSFIYCCFNEKWKFGSHKLIRRLLESGVYRCTGGGGSRNRILVRCVRSRAD